MKYYLPFETVPQEHTRAQVRSALANGCTAGAYVFLYPGVPMVESINAAVDLAASIPIQWPLLWLDVEEYAGESLTPAELHQAVSQCDALGVPCGIYTSRYMWSKLGNPTGFEARPVWGAQYDGVPSLAMPSIPNLPNVVAKQYRGDPLDLSVILDEYTVLALPAPDPSCEEAEAQIAALEARLARVQAIADARPYVRPSQRALRAALST